MNIFTIQKVIDKKQVPFGDLIPGELFFDKPFTYMKNAACTLDETTGSAVQLQNGHLYSFTNESLVQRVTYLEMKGHETDG